MSTVDRIRAGYASNPNARQTRKLRTRADMYRYSETMESLLAKRTHEPALFNSMSPGTRMAAAEYAENKAAYETVYGKSAEEAQ